MKHRTIALQTTVVLLATCVLSAVACAADRATELLEQHIAWLGGRTNITEMIDITLTGRMSIQHLEGSLIVQQLRGGYQRGTYDFGGIKGCEIITPEGGYSISQIGQIEPLDGTRNAEGLRAISQTFGQDLLNATPIYVGKRTRDGEVYEVIQIPGDDDHSRNLYLTSADGNVHWIESLDDGDSTWTHFQDNREVSGLQQPFAITSYATDGSVESEIKWDTIDINSGLTPSAFEPKEPDQKAVDFASKTATSTDWTPFSWYFERYIYVPCTVNGLDTELLLDSGAGITTVDTSFAEQAGIVGHTEIKAMGVGGSQKAMLANGVDIDIAGIELRNLTVAIIDLSEITEAIGRSMDIVLGKEVFNRMIVDVDYPNAQLAFHEPSAFEFEETGHSLQLFPNGQGHRHIEASANGSPASQFQIDTGSGSTVDFFHAFTSDHQLLDDATRVSTKLSGGVGGEMISRVASVDTFDFAGYQLTNVPAGFPPSGDGFYGNSTFAGNIGAGILGRFRVIFDYSRNRMHVIAPDNWDTKPFQRSRIGFSLEPAEEGMRITHVASGSPAEQASLEVGDVIVKIDGQRVSRENSGGRAYKLNRKDVGTRLTMVLNDGSIRTLVLAEYY